MYSPIFLVILMTNLFYPNFILPSKYQSFIKVAVLTISIFENALPHNFEKHILRQFECIT